MSSKLPLASASANDELCGLRGGPEVELLLQVRGVRKRKPMDRDPRGDLAVATAERRRVLLRPDR